MAELLEALTDYGVHMAEKMSSTSIYTDFDNDENKMEKLKFIILRKNKLLFWNNQKLMKLNKIKLLSNQINIKMINMAHQSPQQQKIDTVEKEYKSMEDVVNEANTYFISTKIDRHSRQNREITNISRNS